MAKFWFFTEVDLLNDQLPDWAFGPYSADPDFQFLVTSKHSATAQAKAFAVCDGIVLAQDAGTSTSGKAVITLILKPTQQPPFAFPKIKYFIYRGILKDELIDDADPSKIAGDNSGNIKNDLTKSIWDSQQARNTSSGNTDDAPADALGINFTLTDSDPIDNAFYQDGASFQLPVVKGGWHIGKFDIDEFGFEIMIESIGFDPALGLVRMQENIIDVTAYSSPQNQAEEFELNHEKEAILNYVDPCAFYGNFYNFKVSCNKATPVTSNPENYTGNEVYDELLQGAQFPGAPVGSPPGVFFNKNRIYLDIRNEYNHSMNYFGNYGTDIWTAFDISAPYLSTINYYGNKWPLLTLDGVFPGGNTSDPLTLRIALSSGTGSIENLHPTLYVSCGYLTNTYPKEPKEQAKLIDLIENISGAGESSEVGFNIPNRTGSNDTTPVSSYIKLKYLKRFNPFAVPPVSSGTVIRAGHYLDNLFAPFDMKIPFAGTANIKTVVYDEEAFVNANADLGIDYISSLGLADDGVNLTFFTSPQIIVQADSFNNENNKSIPQSLTAEKSNVFTDFFQLLASKAKTRIVRKSYLQLTSNVDYIEIVESPDASSIDNNMGSIDEISTIATDKNDFLAVNLSSFESKYRIYLGLTNFSTGIDQIGQDYTKYDLVLRGFTNNAGTLEVIEVPTNIEIYSHE